MEISKESVINSIILANYALNWIERFEVTGSTKIHVELVESKSLDFPFAYFKLL